ncbi:NADH:ubiquinone oxidoreductase [Vibrio caribbeanicus]|uniref:NADH:ubiquinone oxidoreductase n=1 Tax=Vibrio caribbeanicus TaxID=701175 RepID=UPI002284FB06|nr:NADH:ubiquinone oxidoreductase [Vibrio caribbeanicus]MCY9844032.1 NADH:ubiquinone oxidoreductase [Vibrio caribbeanicus]
MKKIILLVMSIIAGIASAEHFHSFLLGLYVSTLAVGSCYWFAFRSTKFPELALLLLIAGLFSKITITVVGVSWGMSQDIISSPFIFALSYLFFSIVATFLWFSHKDKARYKFKPQTV